MKREVVIEIRTNLAKVQCGKCIFIVRLFYMVRNHFASREDLMQGQVNKINVLFNAKNGKVCIFIDQRKVFERTIVSHKIVKVILTS